MMTDNHELPNLLACPYCNEFPVYAHGDNQANAIYCTYCPLRVEGAEMSLEQLAKVWNELPRRDEIRMADIAFFISSADADRGSVHDHTFVASKPARSADQ